MIFLYYLSKNLKYLLLAYGGAEDLLLLVLRKEKRFHKSWR
jgi:hypothetical protein